jgi:hypothetical protein
VRILREILRQLAHEKFALDLAMQFLRSSHATCCPPGARGANVG